MFRSDRERRELALRLLNEFKEYVWPAGKQLSPGNVTLAFRDAFMLADFFSQVEKMKPEELPMLGQPMMPPQAQPQGASPRQPNGAGAPMQVVPKPPDA